MTNAENMWYMSGDGMWTSIVDIFMQAFILILEQEWQLPSPTPNINKSGARLTRYAI